MSKRVTQWKNNNKWPKENSKWKEKMTKQYDSENCKTCLLKGIEN